jgi:hypothetical protein
MVSDAPKLLGLVLRFALSACAGYAIKTSLKDPTHVAGLKPHDSFAQGVVSGKSELALKVVERTTFPPNSASIERVVLDYDIHTAQRRAGRQRPRRTPRPEGQQPGAPGARPKSRPGDHAARNRQPRHRAPKIAARHIRQKLCAICKVHRDARDDGG